MPMLICKTKAEVKAILQRYRADNKSIGFVPTMGALHKGHIALVRKSISENNVTACSIFVNPIQFNKQDDLEKYPRTFDKDVSLLNEVGCDILFAPEVDEIYPERVFDQYNFGNLDKVMEGKYRPGHFNGVAVVVRKLFEIIQPTRAYFGKKDFQQLRIIQVLVENLHLGVEIVPCNTIREKDGLAMSSRNIRLTKEQRAVAPAIYSILNMTSGKAGKMMPRELEEWAADQLNKYNEMEVEYLQIVNADDLMPATAWDDGRQKVICVAANLGEVRLIDNLSINL